MPDKRFASFLAVCCLTFLAGVLVTTAGGFAYVVGGAIIAFVSFCGMALYAYLLAVHARYED